MPPPPAAFPWSRCLQVMLLNACSPAGARLALATLALSKWRAVTIRQQFGSEPKLRSTRRWLRRGGCSSRIGRRPRTGCRGRQHDRRGPLFLPPRSRSSFGVFYLAIGDIRVRSKLAIQLEPDLVMVFLLAVLGPRHHV